MLVKRVLIVFVVLALSCSIGAAQSADYVDHEPIRIVNNTDFAAQAGEEGWPGAGIEGDPYVIEGYKIKAEDGYAINISDVTAYFIVRDCYLYNDSKRGIGLHLVNTQNGMLANNTVYKHRYGIRLYNSSDNIIFNNDAETNAYQGIILTYHSSDNRVVHNTLSNPTGYGVSIVTSNNNEVYYNNFKNNLVHASETLSSGNEWDNGFPLGGNYWSGYEDEYPDAEEINDTGIWDTPFEGDGFTDNYPLMEETPKVESVTVSPSNKELRVGESYQFTAVATWTNKSTMDVTEEADWSVNNTVGSVSNGNFTANTTGKANVTATYEGLTNRATVNVKQVTQITLPLKGVNVTDCGETWTENGVELSFVYTTAEDCTEDRCYFGLEDDSVWLYPSRLKANVSGLDVEKVEVDITDWCGSGCTAAFLYNDSNIVDNTSNNQVGANETLVLDGSGASVDRVAVSSCEAEVHEIRLKVQAEDIGMEYSNLSVSPVEGSASMNVTATADVRNTGAAGDYNATFKVDGGVVGFETGTLSSGESTTVTFDHTFDEAGTYNVTIDGLPEETVTVKEKVLWSVPLKVSNPDYSDGAGFGVAENATDGYDSCDEEEPPHIAVEGAVSAYFSKTNGKTHDPLNKSYAGPADSLTYSLVVDMGGLKEANSVIAWDKDRLPGGYSFYLVDLVENETINMKASSSYNFICNDPHQFRIEVEKLPESVATVSVENVSVSKGETGKAEVSIDEVPNDGLSYANLTVNIANSSVAQVQDVSFPSWTVLSQNSSTPSSTLCFKVGDLDDNVNPGDTDVSLATLTVGGLENGTSSLDLTLNSFQDESYNDIKGEISTTSGTITVGQQGPSWSNDLDQDGLYEDVDGSGAKNFGDVIALFNNFDSSQYQDYRSCFDFNGDGNLNFGDIIGLFNSL